eukprot:TRINITY_DN43853_c0_g1_i1.p1 TRINITY_DN43853_c0_g1~~TRINITY_DN43853_c0_g1_i1.p1  ORF type:complete len:188 (-),score=14.13 TRINITY_DN43853_c0_g1_i1:308-871(-)
MATSNVRGAFLVLGLFLCAVVSSAQTSSAPSGTLTPFDEAVRKLNSSGYTSFVSLVSAYGKMKEVKAALSKPLTLLVPSNAAIAKVKITSYSTSQIATIVMFHAIKSVMPFQQIRQLPAKSTIPTLATGKGKAPLVLTKTSGPKARAVFLQGKANSTLRIIKGNFYLKPGKLVVHTTNAIVFPMGMK